MSFWHPEVTSLSGRFLNLNKIQQKVENLIKQLFHSRLLDMRLVIANSALRASLAITISYPTRAHEIIVKCTSLWLWVSRLHNHQTDFNEEYNSLSLNSLNIYRACLYHINYCNLRSMFISRKLQDKLFYHLFSRRLQLISKRCKLYLTERLHIIKADKACNLKKRNELISKCRHKNNYTF